MNKDIFKKDIKDIFKMEVSLKGILIKVIILLAILSYGYFGLYPQYQKYIATKNSVKQATEKLNIYKEKTALMPKYEKQLEEVES
ncbi:pilus assembly protein, partial [Clostridioides difficile]|nr:pilus assembly protein [Clostridioides difficile]